MSDKLRDFLSELAVSPERYTEFLKDPDAATIRAGLDDEDCGALRGQFPHRVNASMTWPVQQWAPQTQP
jgi:hypothetical protein